MRRKRDSARIVVVPKCQDIERRLLLESDDLEWLAYYFAVESGVSSPFSYAFTEQQREMIAALRTAFTEGGDQSIAASRGEGKTSYCERMLLKYTLQGIIDFSVLFAATGSAAENSLDSIKVDLETNVRLRNDYPEVCVPVLALEDTPNRAHYQRVSGFRHDNGEPYEAASSKFSWCGQEIVFPRVPGSPSANAIIATRGLDSAVRGLKKKGKRPTVAVIDDPDTEETAASEEQASKLERRIDRTIAALGGQDRRCARVMLTTLQNRICVSWRFVSPDKPSWKSKRFRFLVVQPTRLDLWAEYVGLKKLDWENEKKGEPTNHAHEFYVAHRDAMDDGAVVSNPNRYVQGELSALQFYYNEVARIGPEAVAAEYDNDPPETLGPIESAISATAIQRQLSGLPRYMIPEGCIILSHGVDVGKWRLHWVVRAWLADGTCHTVDYDFQEVYGQIHGSDEGLDMAIKRAILQRMADFRASPYCDTKGEIVSSLIRDSITTIDSAYRTDGVYAACMEAGLSVYPIRGFGQTGDGATKIKYVPGKLGGNVKAVGDHWKIVQHEKYKVRLVECCSDHWKAWEHDRWMTTADNPGHFMLYGEIPEERSRLTQDELRHGLYAGHIVSEKEVEEPYKGGMRRTWSKKGENHWLDASVYANVGASIRGMSLPGAQVRRAGGVAPASVVTSKPARSLAEMAQAARRK